MPVINTGMRSASFYAGIVGALLVIGQTQAQTLKPFKDDLFAYPAILSSEGGDTYRVVDYRKERDIHKRDEVPERRVRLRYVSVGVRKVEDDLTVETQIGPVNHIAVGKTEGASVITVYLHGQGGSRKQGVDDYMFGGNFNRIKNLMAANNGLYLSPDFSDFKDKGAAEIAALLRHYGERSPNARIIVACGSMGGALCWELVDDPTVAAWLSGMLFLGSLPWDGFLTSAAYRARVPIYIGHGSLDTAIPIGKQEAFFRSILASAPDYPVRFVRFETGSHGTPIRMTDWRAEINWMLAQPHQ